MEMARGAIEDLFTTDDTGAETDNTECYMALKDDSEAPLSPLPQEGVGTSATVTPTKNRRQRKSKHPTKITNKGVLFNTRDDAQMVAPPPVVVGKRTRGRPRKYAIEEGAAPAVKIRTIRPKKKKTKISGES